MKLKLYLQELRAPFFTASIIPVLFGTALAFNLTGRFDLVFFLAALIGGMCLHAGANIANDYFDYKNGSDNINKSYIRPFTGGSRMIQNDLLTPKEVLAESLIFFLLGSLIGVWLIFHLGFVILILGLIGIVSGYFYSSPPFKFVSRGLGEIIIALNFGVLMIFGAYFVQTQNISWLPIVASLPISLLILLVLYINEFPDFEADKESGKKHLVARLGLKKGTYLYIALLSLVYLIIGTGVYYSLFPKFALLSFLTLPIAIFASIRLMKNYSKPMRLAPACASTILLHLVIGVILIIAYSV